MTQTVMYDQGDKVKEIKGHYPMINPMPSCVECHMHKKSHELWTQRHQMEVLMIMM